MRLADWLESLAARFQLSHLSSQRRRAQRRSSCVRPLSFERLEDRTLLSTIDLAGLAAGQGTTIVGAEELDNSGFSVSNAGDVNGDGFDDVIIGAIRAESTEDVNNSAGESYVVFGGPSMPASVDLGNLGDAGFTIYGIDNYDFSGRSVSGAGDVNGDGFDDLIIGAEGGDGVDGESTSSGESYLVFGGADLPSSIDLAELETAGVTLFGADGFDALGWSVAGAGDVNGDGLDDLIVGAYRSEGLDDEFFGAGESYLIFGSSTLPATIDLANLGDAGTVIYGAVQYDYSGISVSGAGDVNGDGFDDLVIGAYHASPGGRYYAGESFVVFGGDALPATIDLANLGSAGFNIVGVDPVDYSGYSVSGAGDVNGDGFDDLIIGARYGDGADGGTEYAGESYLVFGGDDFPSTIELAELGSRGVKIYGIDPYDYSGFSVSAAGDINGDGFDDVIIGASQAGAADNAKPLAGESYVLFGGSDLPESIDLASFAHMLTLFGVDPDDYSGSAVSGAGDVNGDGFDDLIIGAQDAGTSGPESEAELGESYIIFGGDFSESVTHAGTAASETLTGDASANVIIGGQGDDILVGNGGADVLRGGEGDDVLAVSSLAFAKLVGGNGADTLRLDGMSLSLDLAAIPDPVIQGIEVIDLTGIGDNSLTLDLHEVLNLSDESNTVRILKDAGDDVVLGGGWTAQPDQEIESVVYQVFTQGQATVLIATGTDAENDAPVAADDDLTATENEILAGNLFDDNGEGADSDPDGDTFTVAAVNGVEAAVNETFTLDSGALVTVQTNGSFTYDPNGQFDDLTAGQQAVDSFTYTIADPLGATDTALVTITIDGASDGVTYSGSTASIEGTDGDDVFVVNLETGVVTINGAHHQLPFNIDHVEIDGGLGNDQLILHGTSGGEAVRLLAGQGFLDSSSIGVTGQAVSIETIDYFGHGGEDRATFVDSAGDDRFVGRETLAFLSGTGFRNSAHGVGNVIAVASRGGTDEAFLFGTSGDEALYGRPTVATLVGAAFRHQANSFETVNAVANGGTDNATLFDTSGDDTFIARPTYGFLQGAGYRNQATGFDVVIARASGGTDTASLVGGNGDDTFFARPTVAILSGPGFQNQVNGFDRVIGVASAGTDTANLGGNAGADTFVARPSVSSLSGTGYQYIASGFDVVAAFAGAGGTDRGILFDSAGDDLFRGFGTLGQIIGPASLYRAFDFDVVVLHGTSGGVNRLLADASIQYHLTPLGTWV